MRAFEAFWDGHDFDHTTDEARNAKKRARKRLRLAVSEGTRRVAMALLCLRILTRQPKIEGKM